MRLFRERSTILIRKNIIVGVTACVLVLAAHLCGKEDVNVYDGAWVEWFKRSTPEQRENCPE